MNMKKNRFLGLLLMLALLLGLLPGMSLTAHAQTLDDESVVWNEDCTITDDLTIDVRIEDPYEDPEDYEGVTVTVTADLTLTIPAGKTLTVNHGINAEDHTLTVQGGGHVDCRR